LVYSTYLGGSVNDVGASIAIDGGGNALVTGSTFAADFPTANPLQPGSGGALDAFATKLFIAAATQTTLSSTPNPSTKGQGVTFTTTVTSPSLGAPPDGEAVSFMKGKTVLGTGTLSAGTATFTTSTLKVGVNSIRAVYGGDSNFAASRSDRLKQVVEKGAPR
jgi:hypothetical protein